jgi:hypothetical protein
MDRHCEKRRDEAIQESLGPYALWIATSAFGLLAMTAPTERNPVLVEHSSDHRFRDAQNAYRAKRS